MNNQGITPGGPEEKYVDRRSSIKAITVGGLALIGSSAISTPAKAQAVVNGCVQEGWRWCRKCQGMFYAGTGLGVCPTGGAHDPLESGHYYERFGTDVAGVQQGGWSWCFKCQGFFYSRGSTGMGFCPAGGTHTAAGSGAYAAVLGETATGQQGEWRWCSKCMAMFYAGLGLGVCPAGGAHDPAASGHYASLD